MCVSAHLGWGGHALGRASRRELVQSSALAQSRTPSIWMGLSRRPSLETERTAGFACVCLRVWGGVVMRFARAHTSCFCVEKRCRRDALRASGCVFHGVLLLRQLCR